MHGSTDQPKQQGSAISTGNHTNVWLRDSCALENVALGQSSIAVCPLCNLRQNVNNYAFGNQVGLGTRADDLVCEHAVRYNPFRKPFCIAFGGTGESCGLDPEPVCMPSTGNDEIETCFQFQWGWEDCNPKVEDCPCTAFARSPEDDSTPCSSCERCPDDTLSWDCGNVEHAFLRRSYRDCYRNEEMCELGTEGYLKCAEFHGGCTHEGCQCTYTVLDAKSNRLSCKSCGFCADGSISYDCTDFGQGFHFCEDHSISHTSVELQSKLNSHENPQETLCLSDSDGDGVLNCFLVEKDWEECDPLNEECLCEAFVRSTEDGDSDACHSCERCPDDTLAWNCYNLNYPHFLVPFRSCDGDEEHCELGSDGSLLCATYNAGCTAGDKKCPCQYAIRDSNLESFSCGECSFCSDGSIAYDCSAHGKGSHSCGDDDVICCQDCMDSGVFVNPKCHDCIICDDLEGSDDGVDIINDALFHFGESNSRHLIDDSDTISESPSAAPRFTATILPYPLPGIIHNVFH
eukprot:scaffold591_cov176-Amphora_coffeaeformis.AAC.7